jgi:hypothetical protein
MFNYLVGRMHHRNAQMLRPLRKQKNFYVSRLGPLNVWTAMLGTCSIVGHKVSLALDIALRVVSLEVRGKSNQCSDSLALQ